MSTDPRASRAGRRLTLLLAPLSVALCASPLPALANNYGESGSWQFETPNDIATQAAVRDLIERRRARVFAAPVYTTNIARQYNCSVAATATGNSGMQSAIANSPSVTGATSTATGNSNTSSVDGEAANPSIGSGQLNDGAVTSTLDGATVSRVDGTAWQALNSEQANSGNQSASVSGASACAFGVLN